MTGPAKAPRAHTDCSGPAGQAARGLCGGQGRARVTAMSKTTLIFAAIALLTSAGVMSCTYAEGTPSDTAGTSPAAVGSSSETQAEPADEPVDAVCTPTNDRCDAISVCCDGVCDNGQCAWCSHAGGTCNAVNEPGCCPGLTCDNGTCTAP